MHTLDISIPTKKPEVIKKSLEPELKSSPTKKSEIKIEKQKNQIKLKIKSRELSSFRAAMNSWLRWIQVAQESSQIKKKD
ncbi:hypothetical protein C9439_05495 [archaeon SCG-AAA382B04]|nr:hypothetical protein C9439_05495 [archaeon SCG-AAA382B04]